MATDTADGPSGHFTSVTVTGLSALLGIGAAFGSLLLTSGLAPGAAAQDPFAVYTLAGAIAVQFPIIRVANLKPDMGGKDYLYVAFMTFAFWFVTLTILLTAGVTL